MTTSCVHDHAAFISRWAPEDRLGADNVIRRRWASGATKDAGTSGPAIRRILRYLNHALRIS